MERYTQDEFHENLGTEAVTEEPLTEKPIDAKTILVNLKVLGELGKNVKLNTQERYFSLDYTTWDQGIRRFYRGDNRYASYEKIVNLIAETKRMVRSKDYDKNYLLPVLEDAKQGLENLQETYVQDKTFCAQLSLEIAGLDNVITKIKKD